MAKKITGIIKLQIPAGQANPAPPVGPALGQHGVNVMGFCKELDAATKADADSSFPSSSLFFRTSRSSSSPNRRRRPFS